jgi:hypothetical protein
VGKSLKERICEGLEDQEGHIIPVIRHLMAEAWYEGASDGQWNVEHAFQIEHGTRTAIPNPYTVKEQHNDGSEAVRPR